MRVLIAVFDSGIRGLLVRHVEERGHEPVCPPGPEAAVEMHRQTPFPLLLVEVRSEDAGLVHRLREAETDPESYLLAVLPAAAKATNPTSRDAAGEGPSREPWLVAGADDGMILSVDETCVEAARLDLRFQVALHRLESRRALGWGSEACFRQLVEHMNEGLGVRDEDGIILYANPRLCRMLGYRPEELVGLQVQDLVAVGDRARFATQLARRQDGEGSAYELVMTGRDGRKVATLQSGKPLLGPGGEVRGSFAVIHDITERKREERLLRLTQFTVDHAADGVFWIGRDARFLYVNETACESLGYTREELLQMTVHDIDPDFPHELWEESWLEVKQGGVFSRESRHRRKNGEIFPVELRVHCVRWEEHEYHVAVVRDITERKVAEKMLRFNAFHDALTGLPNRALFMDRLQHCMDRSQRSETRFAVLFLDLDRFKVVNDSLGHVVGDQLLARIASRLRASLRAVDTVARVGGDEFLVLVEDIDSDAAAIQVAERIQTDLQRVFHVQGSEIFTSVSIGIAFGGTRYRQAVEILRDADIAMYRSKAQGGGRATIFDPDMHRNAVSRLELETDLRRALQRRQLHLAYQPIVETRDGTVRGFEALVRWQHPQRGELAPAVFLQAAEETGLIAPLTWWVLETACRRARSLADALACEGGPLSDGTRPHTGRPAILPLSINLSSRLIDHPELVERVTQTVDRHGVEPAGLDLEITESVILDHPGRASEVLKELSTRGFRIAIDDFGAGYSSLRYLSRLPVTRVKIDQSFVRRLGEEPKSREITRSVIRLVHNLGMEAVAEGVETNGQLEMLKEMGCDLVQGYLLGRPERDLRILDRLRDGIQPGSPEEAAGPSSHPVRP